MAVSYSKNAYCGAVLMHIHGNADCKHQDSEGCGQKNVQRISDTRISESEAESNEDCLVTKRKLSC